MKVPVWIMTILYGSMLFSCQGKNEQQEQATDLIEITRSQFDSEKMALDTPKLAIFYEYVNFTGMIIPALNASAEISLSLPGVVNKLFCNIGQYVVRGQPIMEIGGNDIIDMQRDYAESSANLLRLSSEYHRLQELSRDNIGSQKELIQAESSFKSERARNTALKIKLEQLGLDVKKVEEGVFCRSYIVTSPISGYVTSVNATVGQYTEQLKIVAEVINVSQFQLKLSVFEKDINKIKSNLKVIFYLTGNKDKTYTAKITTVGKSISSESKAIECFAEIKNLRIMNPVDNQFAEGMIVVDSASVLAIPAESVLRSGNENYVLSLADKTENSYFFNKVKINIGRKNRDYVELVDQSLPGIILGRGLYNLRFE